MTLKTRWPALIAKMVVCCLLSAIFAFTSALVVGLAAHSATLGIVLFPILFLLALWMTWRASSMRLVTAKGLLALSVPLMAIPFAVIIWIFHAAGNGMGQGMGYGGGALVLALFVLVAGCFVVFLPLGALGAAVGAYLGLSGWLNKHRSATTDDKRTSMPGST